MVDQLTQHDPRRIGPFEVLGRLGAGGMGLVYLARSASGRRVAIKTVRTELAEDQLFRVRFTREVEAARRSPASTRRPSSTPTPGPPCRGWPPRTSPRPPSRR